MPHQTDEIVSVGEATGLAWPTVDPDMAVSLMLQEAQLLLLQVGHPPVDESLLRDLSPLGR